MSVNSNQNTNQEIEPCYNQRQVWGKHEKNLNDLVNHQGINDPSETLYIMTMISNHNIEKESELFQQLKNHRGNGCDKSNCSQVMTDTFENRVDMMYDAQLEEWDKHRYSKQTCRAYLRDLFARKSLNGSTMETKAVKKLNESTGFNFKKSTDKVDNGYAVDIVARSSKGEPFAGIQVKPESYKQMSRDRAKSINISKNNKYEHPVFYIRYDGRGFVNLDEVVSQINDLALDIATGK